MAASQSLQRIEGNQWYRGLSALLRRENRKWWGGKRWLLSTAVWVALLNGLLFMALFVLPTLTDPATGEPAMPDNPVVTGVQMFFGLGLYGLAIGIIILMQNSILDEKQMGTAEWVLSKPVSRPAFVVAKLIANTLAMLVTMILIPGIIAYAMFYVFDPTALSLPSFLAAQGIVTLHTFFYLALTLMMGVLVNGRGTVLAAAFGSLFIGQLVPIAAIVQFTPWALANVVTLPVLGQPLPAPVYMMFISTAVWSIVFIAVAIWRFTKLEF